MISGKIYQNYPEYEIIWLFNEKEKFHLPEVIKKANKDSFLGAYYLYTAKYWIDDTRKTILYPKRKGQVYFQTWHGTPLKKIEFDASDKLPKSYLNYAKKDSQSIDFLLSGNRYSSDIFQRAFKVEQSKLLNIGTPRNDELVNFTRKENLDYQKLSKINILFAPTFRDDKEKNGVSQLERIDVANIRKQLSKIGKEVTFSVKFHPNVNKLILEDPKSIAYIQANNIQLIPDGVGFEELFSKTDVLITDYSSIFFDYALLGKPLILFNYDEAEYKEERGFYVDLKELPVPKAVNADELSDILTKGEELFLNSSKNLLEYVGDFESGYSTDKVIEMINEGLKKQ